MMSATWGRSAEIDFTQWGPPAEAGSDRVTATGTSPMTQVIVALLVDHGYCVERADSIEHALGHVERLDLVVAPVTRLYSDVQDAVRRVRNACDRIVIVLVGDTEDSLQGHAAIDAGTDLWLPASHVDVLLVQSARALLRRSSGCFRLHYPRDIKLDASTCAVELQGTRVRLRRAEFRLLSYLIQNHGQWFSEAALLSKVFGLRQIKQTALVRVHVREIRKALAELAGHLQSRRGHGYRFVDRC